jgi:hypothetical protein
LWLKKNNFKLDQVQTFMPTPMAMATTMYHTRKNPLHKVTADSEVVETARSGKVRRAHKAFLRYQDPANWPILRETLVKMGRGDLIGNGDRHLVPSWQGSEEGGLAAGERKRQISGAGTPDKFVVAPKRQTARAIAPTPFIAPESKVRPSILATIKTRAKPGTAKARPGRK